MGAMEHILEFIIKWGIFFFEATGVIILVFSGVKAVVQLFLRRDDARLNLAEGVALALQFKIGGEVLRTVIAATWSELGIIGATIVLRAALTFLIHWEIKHMRKHSAALAANAEEASNAAQASETSAAPDELASSVF
jgi:uncharacterized membrane protein